MAWQTPKTDWVTNPKSPMAVDFNRIEGNIAFVLQEIENKKGAIVDAVNTKRVTASIENSYQEIADIIMSINLNNRVANGTSSLTQITDTSARLTVTGLPFTPSKVFVRGSVRCKIQPSNFDGVIQDNYITYDYGIVNGVISPVTKMGTFVYIYGGTSVTQGGIAKVICSVTYQTNGFVIDFLQTEPSGYLNMDNYGTQYWFAQE